MFEPRQIAPEDRLNKKQRWVAVAMNLLLLAELTLAIYLGQQDPENLTAIFLRTFIPLAIVTVAAARFSMRRLQTRAVS